MHWNKSKTCVPRLQQGKERSPVTNQFPPDHIPPGAAGRPSTLPRATCTLHFSHPGDSSVGLQGDSSTAIPDVDSYSGQDRDAYIDSVPDTLRGNLRSPWGAPTQCTTKN